MSSILTIDGIMSRQTEDSKSNKPMGSEITEAILAGSLGTLPEKESSVVRIFLSSTFTDMQAERNWLMKNSFPHLRKFCQERGLDFQIADMRWGVREDATDDHRTTELCLHEIKNCQRLSRGPNFVAFLGDKYGFRPLPSEIEATEFKLLKNTAMKLGHDISLLLTWYLCDYNREPNMYTLQPISTQHPQYFDMTPASTGARQQAQREWWSVVDKLTTLLRESADYLYREGKISEENKLKYFQSVTECEVHAGILSVEDTTDKVLCFERTLIDIRVRDSIAGRFTDLVEDNLDTEAEKLRENLRMMKIPAKMKSTGLFRYNLQWDKVGVDIIKNKEHISYIKTFGSDFITNIEKMITASLSDGTSTRYRSPLFEEVLHHLHFCRAKCESFCGRENILEEIRLKLSNVHKDGNRVKENASEEESGNADAEKAIRENQKAVLEERKTTETALKELGVTFTSGDEFNDIESDPNFNLRDRLTKLPEITEYTKPLIVHGKSGCGKTALMAKAAELSKVWFPKSVLMIRFLGTSTMSTTIRETILSLSLQICEVYKEQKQTGVDLETDYQFLVQYFAALLWKIDTQDRNLVIILDSVDQLNPADHAHMFSWLPHKLPPGVHVLVSVVSDRLDCLANARLLFPDTDQYVEISELENDVAVDIITVLCKKSNRHLSKKQKNLILDHFAKNGQPLYLRLLVDMSLSWKSYTEVDEKALGVTVKEAINHLFDNLEKSHGAEIVKKSIDVWILGDSVPYWAGVHATATGKPNLKMVDLTIAWWGKRGLGWNGLRRHIETQVLLSSPPSIIILNLGGNDLVKIKTLSIKKIIEQEVLYLRDAFPQTVVIWLDILQRQVWSGARTGDKAIEAKRKRLNRIGRKIVLDSGKGDVITTDIDAKTAFYRPDGVHLNFVGIEFYLDYIKEAIAKHRPKK